MNQIMTHSWLAEVLDDIVAYARINGIPEIIPCLFDAKLLLETNVQLEHFEPLSTWADTLVAKKVTSTREDFRNPAQVLQFRLRKK